MAEQPLLTPEAPVSSSPHPVVIMPAAAARRPASKSAGSNVLLALLLFALVGAVALWANHEASKGFDIVVANADPSTFAGRRFGLLFVENGRAARLILSASDSVERVLYPDESFPRKPVARVTLHLTADGLDGSAPVAVRAGRGAAEFVVRMSPAVMEAADVRAAVARAVLRGMARVWLRDGRGEAPAAVVDALAEYLAEPYAAPAAIVDVAGVNASLADSSNSSSSSCWEDREHAGSFVRYCEMRREGFVARLNRVMEEEWSEQMVDEALLGSPAALLCSAYRLQLQQEQQQRQDDV